MDAAVVGFEWIHLYQYLEDWTLECPTKMTNPCSGEKKKGRRPEKSPFCDSFPWPGEGKAKKVGAAWRGVSGGKAEMSLCSGGLRN